MGLWYEAVQDTMIPFDVADTITIVAMALLFAAVVVTGILAWRRRRSSPGLARALQALIGLGAYLLLLSDIETGGYERWLLRIIVAMYVLPHLLANVDTLKNHRADRTYG